MLTDAWVLHWEPGPGHSDGQQRLRDPCSTFLSSWSLRTGEDTQTKDPTESDRGTKAGVLDSSLAWAGEESSGKTWRRGCPVSTVR